MGTTYYLLLTTYYLLLTTYYYYYYNYNYNYYYLYYYNYQYFYYYYFILLYLTYLYKFINLLAPHGAQAVIAFRYSPTLLLLPSPPIFSKYSPQTSQNQSLEEASNGLCVEATP